MRWRPARLIFAFTVSSVSNAKLGVAETLPAARIIAATAGAAPRHPIVAVVNIAHPSLNAPEAPNYCMLQGVSWHMQHVERVKQRSPLHPIQRNDPLTCLGQNRGGLAVET